MKKSIITGILVCFFYFINAYAYNGIYFTGEGGISTQDNLPRAAAVGANKISTNTSFNSYRGSVGYNHDLTHYFGFGLNIGYGEYGKTTYYYSDGLKDDVISEAIECLTVSTFHITKQIDLFLKLGGIRQTVIIRGKTATEEDTNVSAEAGIGSAYNFMPRLAATLTYSRLFNHGTMQNFEGGHERPGVNEFLIGLRYTFCS